MAQVPERKQSCVPAAQKAKYEENCQDNSYDGPGYDAYNGRGFSIHGYLLSQLKSCPDNRLYSSSDQKYDPGYIPAHSAEAYDKIQNCGECPDSAVDCPEGLAVSAVVLLPFSEVVYNGAVICCIARAGHIVIEQKSCGRCYHKEHEADAYGVMT